MFFLTADNFPGKNLGDKQKKTGLRGRNLAMKIMHLFFFISLCLSGLVQGQTPFADALATFDIKPLRALRTTSPTEQFHRDLVLQTIAIADRQQVRIDPKAAIELDELFASVSATVANEPRSSEQLKLFPGNRVRFIGRMISFAEPQVRDDLLAQAPIALITPSSLQALKKDLQSSIAFFCPCWPFCR